VGVFLGYRFLIGLAYRFLGVGGGVGVEENNIANSKQPTSIEKSILPMDFQNLKKKFAN
jgi:hypothetical protein